MVAATCNQREIKSAPGTAVYRRRLPERSTAYQVMQGHLETWLAGCRHTDEEGLSVADEDRTEAGAKTPSYAASLWAMLIARIYEVFLLVCPQCGDEL